MKNVWFTLLRVLLVGFLGVTAFAAIAAAEETTEGSRDPLAPFEKLIGGEWHLQGTIQVFEWGVGRKSVISKSYTVANGERTLVSEGTWFWHPGEKSIIGYFTAVGMGINLFAYRTRFDDGDLVSELVTFDATGEPRRWLEIMEFKGDDTYSWTLYDQSTEESKKFMDGTSTRRGVSDAGS